MTEAAARDQAACESRFVEAGGHGKFVCSLAGSTPIVGTPKAEAEAGAEFTAAKDARDWGALDAILKGREGQYLFVLETACTKSCADRGPNLIAVQKQGVGRVEAYKRCMIAADSTLEARKLAAYETDLYCGYLHSADARCRLANRCDWLEEFSEKMCNYASPGIGRCQ